EGSVASGIRRIEAVTGEAVRSHLTDELNKHHQHIQKLLEDHTRLTGELGRKSDFSEYAYSPSLLQNITAREIIAVYRGEFEKQQALMEQLQEANKKL